VGLDLFVVLLSSVRLLRSKTKAIIARINTAATIQIQTGIVFFFACTCISAIINFFDFRIGLQGNKRINYARMEVWFLGNVGTLVIGILRDNPRTLGSNLFTT
jgi:hypothetical protein